MAEQAPLLHLQNRHITSLRVDELDAEETFKHHLCMVDKPLDHRIGNFLYMAGFYHATFLRGYKLVPGLITALIERWRPETHTFHMPCGECTITLEDVVYLIGVPVNGKPVVERTVGSTAEICQWFLGKEPYESDVKGSRVKMSWLEREFQLSEYNTVEEINMVSRAYILQMIGGILMPNKSGNMVNVRYLRFLDTPWEPDCQYSWGSAILACLYRELCKGALLKKGQRVGGIGGCLLLLQAWAWQRLLFFTPLTRTHVQFPVVARWCDEKHETGLAHNNVRVCKSLIDSHCQEQFIWKAYEDDHIFVPEYLMNDSLLWCSVTPLIHFSTVEFHFADRVLRQFGFHQPIPCIPRDHYYLHAYDGRDRPDTDWKVKHSEYIALWNNRASSLPEHRPMEDDDFDFESSEYMIYYRSHGMPYLTNQSEREECERFRKKYGGKSKSSKATTSSSQRQQIGSRDPTGWPTTWEPPVAPPMAIWEKEPTPTCVQPEVALRYSNNIGFFQPATFIYPPVSSSYSGNVGGSSSGNVGFNDPNLYRPEFISP